MNEYQMTDEIYFILRKREIRPEVMGKILDLLYDEMDWAETNQKEHEKKLEQAYRRGLQARKQMEKKSKGETK